MQVGERPQRRPASLPDLLLSSQVDSSPVHCVKRRKRSAESPHPSFFRSPTSLPLSSSGIVSYPSSHRNFDGDEQLSATSSPQVTRPKDYSKKSYQVDNRERAAEGTHSLQNENNNYNDKTCGTCHECKFCLNKCLSPVDSSPSPSPSSSSSSDVMSLQPTQSQIVRQQLLTYLTEPSAFAVFALKRQRPSSSDVGTSREESNNLCMMSLSPTPSTVVDKNEAVEDNQEVDEDEPSDNDFQELYFPDELILKELNEMRLILHKLLESNRELAVIASPLTSDDDIISSLLGLRTSLPGIESNPTSVNLLNASSTAPNTGILSTDSVPPSKEPHPHYPVGASGYFECGVCLESSYMYRRACCSFPACSECISSYFTSKIDLGLVAIECINTKCRDFVHRDEISVRLPSSLKPVYLRLLANANADELSKTCPRCNNIMTLESAEILKNMKRMATKDPTAVRVECVLCRYLWCFPCSSPWHEGITCKQYFKGDRLLYDWARQVSQGQVNAQKCPKCKILIQKSSGCDHMHCTRCKTDFCYRCGDTLRRLKFFGDHYSKLSVFGCKYRYKASQPIQRKLIRGAVFGSKLMVAPVLGSLALVAGAVVIGVGVAALPLYGGLRLYRKYQHLTASGGGHRDTRVRHRSQGKDVVSTGAQTIQITFIGDHYVDEYESDITAATF